MSGGRPTVGHCICSPDQNRKIYTNISREKRPNQPPAVGGDNPHIHSRGAPLVSQRWFHYITKDLNQNNFLFLFVNPFSFILFSKRAFILQHLIPSNKNVSPSSLQNRLCFREQNRVVLSSSWRHLVATDIVLISTDGNCRQQPGALCHAVLKVYCDTVEN